MLLNMEFPHDDLPILASCHYSTPVTRYINASNGTWGGLQEHKNGNTKHQRNGHIIAKQTKAERASETFIVPKVVRQELPYKSDGAAGRKYWKRNPYKIPKSCFVGLTLSYFYISEVTKQNTNSRVHNFFWHTISVSLYDFFFLRPHV